MKTFGIYEHPENGLEAVKKGFSWPGFIFGFFWAIYKKCWSGVAVIIGIKLIVYIVLTRIHIVDEQVTSLLTFSGNALIWIIPGVFGNKWCASRLIRNGYKLIGTAEETYPETAIEIYKSRKGTMSSDAVKQLNNKVENLNEDI